MSGSQTPARGQSALFTFLGYSLVGPFFAGFATLAGLVLAVPLGLGALLPDGVNAGHAALQTFVWSAVPASLAGLALALIVWRRGSFPWVAAVAAGGLAFMVAAIAMPLPTGLALTPLTAFAAFIAIAVRHALVSGGIIAPE